MARQASRTKRQGRRSKRREQKQEQKTTRTATRQSKRAERQKVRQEQKTQRTLSRQARKTVKEQAKAQSGYYSPEGQQAKWAGISGVAEQGIKAGTTIGAAVATGGASLGAEGALGGILGGLGQMGAQPDNGFGIGGGGGGFAGEEFDVQPMSVPWYKQPLILGALGVAGIGLIMLGTRKK